jgi:hypothetical protein
MRPAVAWRLAVFLSLSSFLPPLSSGDSTYATVCSKTGKYKPTSTYDSNVQYVTNFLTNYASFTSGTGFATVAYGNAPDEVHGLGLCRGDIIDNVTCFECLSTASMVAPALCPYDKDAALFYDGCIMRFSDQDFLFFKDNEPVVGLNTTETVKPAAAASSFDALVDLLINKTAEHAAASGVPPMGKKVATGEAVFDAGGHQTAVYTLVQCTPDLTAAECSGCLDQVKYILADRVPEALGGRVAGVRCNGRFEVYPFYIGKAMVRVEGLEAPAPAPAPLPLRPLPPLVPLMPPLVPLMPLVSSGSQKGK